MEAVLTLLLLEALMTDVSAICPRVTKSYDTEICHIKWIFTSRFDIKFIDAGQNIT